MLKRLVTKIPQIKKLLDERNRLLNENASIKKKLEDVKAADQVHIPFRSLKAIYDALQDDLSRKWFLAVLLYRLENERFSYLLKAIVKYRNNSDYHDWPALIKQRLDGISSKEILIVGENNFRSRRVFEALQDLSIPVSAFVSEDKQEKSSIFNIPVISINDISNEYTDHAYIIIQKYSKIKKMLLEKGINEYNIYPCFEYWRKQYFHHDLFKPCADEVFVDGGCYDASSSLDFIEWCGGTYDHIYAFEPSLTNLDKCKKNCEMHSISNIDFIDRGLWSKETTLYFDGRAAGSSKIVDSGDEKILTVALDSFLNGKRVTFIKLDLEGAEFEALMGAAETIKKYRPKLAICVYHKRQDIIDLPHYILSLVPDYKFYIRHYATTHAETVLLAVI